MLTVQQIPEPHQFLAQPFSGIVAMVEVDFYFAAALLHQLAKAIKAIRIVLFLGIEKRMLGQASVGITKRFCHGGKFPEPALHIAARRFLVRFPAVWLIMIAHSHDKVAHTIHSPRTPQQRPQIPHQPPIHSPQHDGAKRNGIANQSKAGSLGERFAMAGCLGGDCVKNPADYGAAIAPRLARFRQIRGHEPSSPVENAPSGALSPLHNPLIGVLATFATPRRPAGELRCRIEEGAPES
ncbi:MAG: hypothetical protein QGG69_03635 [Kiritimatiellia bacterium]|jgi:hypothetical protein|nr:hypothetical protein [Kiritimatiellia bacterium]MDP6629916.1 hypothetical protein [Kiritimatiellia bacterium]MDP6810114.1 hypothetical protein [Kiritimatiellia bacterium]